MEHATLELAAGTVALRDARADDLAELVALLAADQLGRGREDPAGDLGPYRRAFDAIESDPAQLLLCGELDGRVVATMQLSLIPGLARGGALRGQIEAVRVAEELRSEGLGQAMVEWAIEECRRRGCALVQLTTDKQRGDAHRFYERLGFVASHEGMKLAL